MKFSQKIFIMSFILIIISINIIGFMIIKNNHKINIDNEINRNIIQINNISNNLRLYRNIIDTFPTLSEQYLRNNTYMQIQNNNDIIYSNLLNDYDQIKTNLLLQNDEICAYIEDVNKSQILFMALKDEPYRIITATNISEIYKIRDQQISLFTEISFACSLIIAVILYFFCYIVTKRINKLNKAVDQISQGNYDVQVDNAGNDEIGNLSKAFNQMASSVNKNIEEINNISENRKTFINNITHEIRTPLTSIIGFSSLINNKKIVDKDTVIEYSNKIYNEGVYINEITNRLTDMILLDNGKINFDTVNLSKIIKSICLDLQETLDNVQIETNIETNFYARVNSTLIRSLLTNLIKNSAKAYDIKKKAIVKVDLLKDNTIKITDYGRGIPKHEIEKIKTPFYTLDKARSRKVSGMGLGLPLCIKIVEIHKGTLKITSKINKGTEVSINLIGGTTNEKY